MKHAFSTHAQIRVMAKLYSSQQMTGKPGLCLSENLWCGKTHSSHFERQSFFLFRMWRRHRQWCRQHRLRRRLLLRCSCFLGETVSTGDTSSRHQPYQFRRQRTCTARHCRHSPITIRSHTLLTCLPALFIYTVYTTYSDWQANTYFFVVYRKLNFNENDLIIKLTAYRWLTWDVDVLWCLLSVLYISHLLLVHDGAEARPLVRRSRAHRLGDSSRTSAAAATTEATW